MAEEGRARRGEGGLFNSEPVKVRNAEEGVTRSGSVRFEPERMFRTDEDGRGSGWLGRSLS